MKRAESGGRYCPKWDAHPRNLRAPPAGRDIFQVGIVVAPNHVVQPVLGTFVRAYTVWILGAPIHWS
jgi:hypothetical protein